MIEVLAAFFYLLGYAYALAMIAVISRLVMAAFGPWPLAVVSALSLLDAANCVYEGHTDWWFPTLVAVITTAYISNQDRTVK